MTRIADIILRDYQDNDLVKINEAFDSHNKVLYQLATGGGKSIVVTKFVADHRKKNILVLSHKRRLLYQMKGHLTKAGMKVGLMISSLEEDMDANVVIVSIRTAVKSRRLELLLKRNWDYVIVDEARHTRTTSYDTVLDEIFQAHPDCKLLGVDATPYRKDKKRLDKHFDVLVQSQEDIASLTSRGYLQKCKAIVSPIDKESLKETVKEYTGDYQMTQLSEYMRQAKYINYVINQYKEYGEGRQALVFAVDKAHAKDLKIKFEENGYKGKVEQIDSDMSTDEIEKAYTKFETKKAQILINIEMATEGVDLPVCGCIVGARPTKSLTLYLQMGGRGMRPDGEHEYFILLDCCGWTDEFGVLSSPKHWTLNPEVDPNNPRKKNKVVGKRKDGSYTEDLTEFIGEVIEMTPEEYIEKLAGGVEAAEKVNKEIDEKIASVKKEMGSELQQILKIKDLDELYEYKVDSDDERVTIMFALKTDVASGDHRWYNVKTVTIKVQKGWELFANISALDNGWSAPKFKEVQSYLILTQLAGQINHMLMDEKKAAQIKKKFNEMLEQVKDMKEGKIDVYAMKSKAREIEEEKWEKLVKEHAKTNGVFTLTKPLREDEFFKGYSSHQIFEIHVNNIVSYHNKIKVKKGYKSYRDSDGEFRDIQIEEKNYVKGEKVLELIKKGEWKAPK